MSIVTVPSTSMNENRNMSKKLVLFPDGPGFTLVAPVSHKGESKIDLVRSLKDGQIYVRKQKEEYNNPDHIIQCSDVRNLRILPRSSELQMPELQGWSEYHNESTSNMVCCASYWSYCNAGTISELQQRLELIEVEIPVALLWSMLQQMMQMYLYLVDHDVVHSDAHASNWMLHANPRGRLRINLIDWQELNQRQHFGEERMWWEVCHTNITIFVVQIIRDFFFSDCKRELTASGVQTFEVRQDSPYFALNNALRQIEMCTLSAWLDDGTEWLRAMHNITSRIEVSATAAGQYTIPDICSLVPIKTLPTQVTFAQALNLGELDPAQLWKVAEVQESSMESTPVMQQIKIISVQGRRSSRHTDLFVDHTPLKLTSEQWQRDCTKLKKVLGEFDLTDEPAPAG